MSRRVSLPGADELFRTTGGTALQPSSPRRPANGEARVPAPAGESDETAAAEDTPQSVPVQGGDGEGAEHVAAEAEPAEAGESRTRPARRQAAAQEGSAAQPRKRGRAAARRPSGRERHDEKITVYVSAEELMDLEHARLVLRGEHGLAVDRGRIVREAVAVVLADLESRGDASILVRRLRGR
ncbi:hypothetical protein JK359_30235 [Streptomyces actinomycinicus]|uniref:Cobyrinic acid a,c-diamide synthase n=1 Tax=Streptomyces actinomycinicus TaxID=1695166 RepID=A0A937EMT1_9ACTN|nr:hypothetical protein [Streptomyces actinomycinicus]MBL1086193.1 hypothetical protein [Streptomyces actinomycinicus]